MVLEVIIAILLFLAGALLYTFGILRVLLCYTSAIPLTRELKTRYPGRVAAGAIYMKIAYTTVFWLIITVAATLAVIGWGLDYSLFGYLGGILLTFATTIGRLGRNQRNVANYLVQYERFIDKQLGASLLEKAEHGDISLKV